MSLARCPNSAIVLGKRATTAACPGGDETASAGETAELPVVSHQRTCSCIASTEAMGQNRPFVAGFLAITSNAQYAERSNDRCFLA